MAKITTNFSLEEFNCKDGSTMPNDVMINIIKLAKNLQVLRDAIGKSIVINSAYRSPDYNKKIGGVKDSQHLKGNASDITVKGMTPKEVAKVIEGLIMSGKMQQGGIGIYPNFVHYDIRGVKARW
jgi:uncharacterized protein YcbK (DUF882 family)